jgi:hypothetical protein
MKIWNYCTLSVEPDIHYGDKRRIVILYHTSDGDNEVLLHSGVVPNILITNSISQLGKDGWEIMWRDITEQTQKYFFKRKQ